VIDLGHLGQLTVPAIIHWDLNHFVVLKSVTRRGIVIYDPAAGEKLFPISEASKHLTGVALELSPLESFNPKDERARLPFSTFWGQSHGSTHALVQILIAGEYQFHHQAGRICHHYGALRGRQDNAHEDHVGAAGADQR
jgi:ATP-binding cassette subfamily B protein RaxB